MIFTQHLIPLDITYDKSHKKIRQIKSTLMWRTQEGWQATANTPDFFYFSDDNNKKQQLGKNQV